MRITRVFAREVLDSRGNPTVEVEVKSDEGFGRAIAPSGASTGAHEALELRDGGFRLSGKGVQNAVANVNNIIAREITGLETAKQKEIDARMISADGTEAKSVLGANAMVAVSMAALKCAASEKGMPLYRYMGGKALPVPMLNILNGGKHAGNSLAIQEFMIMPVRAGTFRQALEQACTVYHALGARLSKKYGVQARNVGDEGGFAPSLSGTAAALDEIAAAIEECGLSREVKIAMDCAASSFYDTKTGKYAIDGKSLDAGALLDYYMGVLGMYDIISIEDPFFEDDFKSFALLNSKLSGKIQVVGDDLLVTNPMRLKSAIERKSVSALLMKVNQIGTVSESIEVASMCRKAGINIVVSHRSGETEDTFIADFAVGINAGQIKTGAPARGERTCKYNQLLRISEDAGVSMSRVP
jgi:enolase